MRKRTLVKLAGGFALAVTGVLVSATGASATSGYHSYNSGNSGYKHSNNHNSYHNNGYKQSYAKHYDNKSHHSYGRGSGHTVVYKTNYSAPSGLWYGGKWYSYHQIGYWDHCGNWVAYRPDWSHDDWYKWHKTLY
jgi:hypothetical protein